MKLLRSHLESEYASLHTIHVFSRTLYIFKFPSNYFYFFTISACRLFLLTFIFSVFIIEMRYTYIHELK